MMASPQLTGVVPKPRKPMAAVLTAAQRTVGGKRPLNDVSDGSDHEAVVDNATDSTTGSHDSVIGEFEFVESSQPLETIPATKIGKTAPSGAGASGGNGSRNHVRQPLRSRAEGPRAKPPQNSSVKPPTRAQLVGELCNACRRNDAKKAFRLLEQQVPGDAFDEQGWTPLGRAASMGHDALVRLVLEYGVGPNLHDSNGHTALHVAASGGRDHVIRVLVEKGADPNFVNSAGATPLSIAKTINKPSTLRALQGLPEDSPDEVLPTPKFHIGELVVAYADGFHLGKVLSHFAREGAMGLREWCYKIHFLGYADRYDVHLSQGLLEHVNRLSMQKIGESSRPEDQTSKRRRTDASSKAMAAAPPPARQPLVIQPAHPLRVGALELYMPQAVRVLLASDAQFVNLRKKLLRLPRSPCVADLLSIFQSRKESGPMADDEVESLTVLFDLALPYHLLYRMERPQYAKLYSQAGFRPSRVYGIEHLLRFLSICPWFLFAASYPPDELSRLRGQLEALVRMLEQRLQDNETTASNYFDAPPQYLTAFVMD
eukprot:m.235295 g.235295  ORF g.235295 m.235295 type:complete len:543 (+) comp18924_c0_seq4:122-1750(+)